ncbi:MAG: DUF5703 family protein [Actinomycetota bacterium]|nr:DUF5703 family protein [Actinomycetota bacterium]
MSGMDRGAPPAGADPDWEYAPLRIPAEVGRVSAAAQLSLHAEFGDWELARVQRYVDGTRRVLLRRERRTGALPLPRLPL